jgi:ABC-type branched-subunit amino acid transport system substrate-binding protein
VFGLTEDVHGVAEGISYIPAAAQAAVDEVNAGGGIGGHPMKLTVCDDQESASGGAACWQSFANNPTIVASAGSLSLYTDASTSSITQGKMPVVGGYAVGAFDLTNPLSFLTSGGTIGEFSGMGAAAIQQGAKTVTIIGQNLSQAALIRTAITSSVTAAGGKSLNPVLIAPTETNLAAAATQAISENPDAVLLPLPATQVSAAVVALRDGGYSGLILAGADDVGQAFLDNLGISPGKLVIVSNFPFPAQTTTAWGKLYNQDINTYASSVKKYADWASVLLVWIGVKVAAQVANTIKGPVTRASMLAALNAQSALTTGGEAPTINWTTAGPIPTTPRVPNGTYDLATIKNGKFVWDGTFHSYLPGTS